MEKIYNGDRKKKMVVDLSPFFLLEAAGDSEGDLDHHHNMMMVMGMGSCHDNDEEDDAQSCSYESSDVWDGNNIPSHINKVGNDVCRSGTHNVTTVVHHYGNYHHGHDDDDIDDDEGRLIFKDHSKKGRLISELGYSRDECNKCTSEVMSTANSNSSRKLCIDSIGGKKLSEKERSRLFWETCLAS